MEIGVYTFGEVDPQLSLSGDEAVGQRLRDLIEEIEVADQVGLDVFGVGEHHRPDYAVSAPAIVLAAAASRTSSIRLSSAVTVLGSEDPVRAFQQYSTIDLISNGRAEIMAGRGSFIESFPLFGYDLNDYDEVFSEHLELLLRLREEPIIQWSGKHRPDIPNRGVYPRPKQNPLPVWIAVGGTPESALRAGRLGVPMALAIIGGLPERFVGMAELHRRGAGEAGHPLPRLSINSHGFIADDAEEARDLAFPAFKATMDRLGRERGCPPMSREQFDASCTLRGANFVGSPDQIVEKILYQHDLFGHDRFLLQLSVGPMPHDKMLRAIELLGTKVAPAVREALAEKSRAAGNGAAAE